MTSTPSEPPFTRFELACGAAYAALILWINLYICRELFSNETAYMNSMHGFWTALAKGAGNSWFWPHWWPFWDEGVPFEFVYAPLVPGLGALWAAARGIPPALAIQSITGLAYCLAPLTLFLLAWMLTRAPGFAFSAALVYSLTAPTQIIVPDNEFSLRHFWDARRLFLVTVWDDTPHLLALALVSLAILFLSLSIRNGRPLWYGLAILTIATASLASIFGAVAISMAALCLLFVLRRERWLSNTILTAAIGAFAYAICSPFLSPASLRAIHAASKNGGEGGFGMGSVTAIAMVALGWAVLWRYLPRWTSDWTLQFFALFAYLTSSVPIIGVYLHRQFLPQSPRYKFEMELALALLIVFALRRPIERFPVAVKCALVFLLLSLTGEQIVNHRQYAKGILQFADPARTIEYRTSRWAEKNLPGVRVSLPGSIAMWANAFTDVQQFSGGSWSVAYNQIQQIGDAAARNGGETAERDARVSLAWLRAFGAGAVALSGPNSQEYWKATAHPSKFAGLLPELWRDDGVTIYRIPQRTASLAHVVPESALVKHAPAGVGDIEEMERYDAALDDASLPVADFKWEGRDRIRIRTAAAPAQVISVQVTHHPGWHAKVNGISRQIERDGLGLMWLRPECNGPCEAVLEYDGGWQLLTCRVVSYAAIIALLPLLYFLNKRRFASGQNSRNAFPAM